MKIRLFAESGREYWTKIDGEGNCLAGLGAGHRHVLDLAIQLGAAYLVTADSLYPADELGLRELLAS